MTIAAVAALAQPALADVTLPIAAVARPATPPPVPVSDDLDCHAPAWWRARAAAIAYCEGRRRNACDDIRAWEGVCGDYAPVLVRDGRRYEVTLDRYVVVFVPGREWRLVDIRERCEAG